MSSVTQTRLEGQGRTGGGEHTLPAPGGRPPRGRRVRESLGDRITDGFLVVPGIALAVAIFLYPTAVTLVRSFTDWSPGADAFNWVGVENFSYLFGDETFHKVLGNSLIYLLGVPLWVIVPLVITLMLYDRVPRAAWFRTIYLFPLVLSPAVLGLLFATILNPTNGLLNQFLDAVGLHALTAQWIDDPSLVKFSIIMISLWGGLGMTVLILHAAMSAIQPELFEAAELDGAGWWSRMRHVMIPGIKPALEAVIALLTVNVFITFFGLVSVLTNGGPNNASASMDFDVYQRAFSLQDFPASAAESLVLIVLVIVTVLVLVGLRRGQEGLAEHASRRTRAGLGERIAHSRGGRAIRSGAAAAGAAVRRVVPRLRWSPLRFVIAVLIAVVFIYPMIYMIGTATRTAADFNADPIGLPTTFDPTFLAQAWAGLGYGRAFLNSFITVGVGLVVCAALSSLASFWLYRHRGPVRAIVIAVIGIFYFVPTAVWIIPLNTTLAGLGLSNNLLVVGVVYGVAQFPFGVALLSTYLARGLSEELLEAARVDGASLFRQYWSIVLPLSAPALASLMALTAAFMWGDLLIGLILLQDPSLYPVTLAASQLVGRFSPSLQVSAATAVLSFIPLLILFITTQRFMVRGIAAGAGRV